MTQHAILFSPPMAIARRERRKSQTRRIVKPQPKQRGMGVPMGHDDWAFMVDHYAYRVTNHPHDNPDILSLCPYGIPGDKLRELTTWSTLAAHDHLKPTALPLDAPIWSYYDSDEKPQGYGRLRAGRYLPLTLRHHMPLSVPGVVRVQRVQEISTIDAISEGIDPDGGDDEHRNRSSVENFAVLWNAVNGPSAWARNDWVWALTLSDGARGVA